MLDARLVITRAQLLEQHHGLVKTSELLAIGIDTEMLRWSPGYGVLVHVRQGWWAKPGTPPLLLQVWRAGGRLACVSALAFHGELLDIGGAIHIEVAGDSHGAVRAGFVVHWSRDQSNGDRRAVSVEVAQRQANRCHAANGTL